MLIIEIMISNLLFMIALTCIWGLMSLSIIVIVNKSGVLNEAELNYFYNKTRWPLRFFYNFLTDDQFVKIMKSSTSNIDLLRIPVSLFLLFLFAGGYNIYSAEYLSEQSYEIINNIFILSYFIWLSISNLYHIYLMIQMRKKRHSE